jgi:hypothetical protein
MGELEDRKHKLSDLRAFQFMKKAIDNVLSQATITPEMVDPWLPMINAINKAAIDYGYRCSGIGKLSSMAQITISFVPVDGHIFEPDENQ